jgi:hypothetical protein
MDQGGVESEDQEMSQNGSVFTWDPHNIYATRSRERGESRKMALDQGGVKSEDKECHKMALYLPVTPETWTREE